MTAPADRRRVWRALLGIGLTCTVIFVGVAAKATSGVPNRIDRAAADRLMASSETSVSYRVGHFFSAGGSPTFVALIAIGLAVVVWSRRWDLRLAAWCLLAPALAGVLELGAKNLVGPQQPVWFNRWFPEEALAFPSGHATGAASIATLVIVLAFTAQLRRSSRAAVIVVAAGYAVAVALSRVVIGYHLAMDAVGGLLLGTGVTALCGVIVLSRPLLVERRAARHATSDVPS